MQSLLKSLSATIVHVAVFTPGGARVIEARPCGSHHYLSVLPRRHLRIEVLKVLLSPVAAVGFESLFPGMDPCVIAVEQLGVRAGLVLIYKERGRGPRV